MTTLYHAALDDLSRVFDRLDDRQVDRAVEEIARAYVEAGGVSGRTAIYEQPDIKAKYKFVEPMVASWQKGVPEFRPRFPAWPAISEVVAEFGSKMMLGEVTTEQGAKEIGTRLESVLAKEGYYDGKKALRQ